MFSDNSPIIVMVDDDGAPLPVEYARSRLKWCIKRDREACEVGWWEQLPTFFEEAAAQVTSLGILPVFDMVLRKHGDRAIKPRYRWTVRR